MSAAALALQDSWIVTRRHLIRIKRIPDLLIFATIRPIMFMLLFALVFGGAIPVDGVSYREFLMAGVFVQTVVFAAGSTATGLTGDLQQGIVDRFRSLPMSRAAVLLGRTTSDLLTTIFVVGVMSLTGLLLGWRISTDVRRGAAGYLLLIIFGYAMTWISATIGLSARSFRVARSAGFSRLFPLTFLSNAFVPTSTLPGWLQPIAEWNPISSVVLGLRILWGNAPQVTQLGGGFPTRHPIPLALLWTALILIVFIPLSMSRYRRSASH